jgi:hypothetical protein
VYWVASAHVHKLTCQYVLALSCRHQMMLILKILDEKSIAVPGQDDFPTVPIVSQPGSVFEKVSSEYVTFAGKRLLIANSSHIFRQPCANLDLAV